MERPQLHLAKLSTPPPYAHSTFFDSPASSSNPGSGQFYQFGEPSGGRGGSFGTKGDFWAGTANSSSPPSPSTIGGGECFPPSVSDSNGEGLEAFNRARALSQPTASRRNNLSLNINNLPTFQQNNSPSTVASSSAPFTDAINYNYSIPYEYFQFAPASAEETSEAAAVPAQNPQFGYRLPASQPSSPVRTIFPPGQAPFFAQSGRQRGATFSGRYSYFNEQFGGPLLNSIGAAVPAGLPTALPTAIPPHLAFTQLQQSPIHSPLLASPVIQTSTAGQTSYFDPAPVKSDLGSRDVTMDDLATPTQALPSVALPGTAPPTPLQHTSISRSSSVAVGPSEVNETGAMVEKLMLFDQMINSAQEAKNALLRGEDASANLGQISHQLDSVNELSVAPTGTPQSASSASPLNYLASPAVSVSAVASMPRITTPQSVSQVQMAQLTQIPSQPAPQLAMPQMVPAQMLTQHQLAVAHQQHQMQQAMQQQAMQQHVMQQQALQQQAMQQQAAQQQAMQQQAMQQQAMQQQAMQQQQAVQHEQAIQHEQAVQQQQVMQHEQAMQQQATLQHEAAMQQAQQRAAQQQQSVLQQSALQPQPQMLPMQLPPSQPTLISQPIPTLHTPTRENPQPQLAMINTNLSPLPLSRQEPASAGYPTDTMSLAVPPPLVHSHSFPNGHQLPSQLHNLTSPPVPLAPSPSFAASLGIGHPPHISSPLANVAISRPPSPRAYPVPDQQWLPIQNGESSMSRTVSDSAPMLAVPRRPSLQDRAVSDSRADGLPVVHRGRSGSTSRPQRGLHGMTSSVPPSAWNSRAVSPDDEDEEESDDEAPRKSKRRRSSAGHAVADTAASTLISEDMRRQLDRIFEEFLNIVCSDLDMVDAKGEKLHQVLMPKKMQRMDESGDYRPFKFRIQAFTNAFSDELVHRGITEETMSAKKIKSYLWKQDLISRFNADGKKAKSKGNHIWNVDAKKMPEGNEPKWVFRPFKRRIIGTPSAYALINQRYEYEPKVWDPQAATETLKPVFYSPPNSLPDWMRWEDGKLVGVPTKLHEATDIVVKVNFTDVDGQAQTLSTSFMLAAIPPALMPDQMVYGQPQSYAYMPEYGSLDPQIQQMMSQPIVPYNQAMNVFTGQHQHLSTVYSLGPEGNQQGH